ncbi:hypothetical protein [Halosegnis sp.]|uniref:hypothetical protein n=1 Tax=Halosegnis sp. TaxID=2864959 RepID=UPI0035D4AD31
MSISIDTVRTEERATDERPDLPPATWLADSGDGLDVTDLPFDRVATYARRADAEVYLERRGGRTRLVPA